MKKGDLITSINEVNFYYLCWNTSIKCHIVYTDDDNFYIGKNKDIFPNEHDCKIVYHNYYN